MGVGRSAALFAFLHHVAAFTLVSALAVELVLIRQELTLAIARKLPAVDAVLGASAGFLLIVGLLRVFYFEKGADYYFHSHAFMTKFTGFIAVALLSIIPTANSCHGARLRKKGRCPLSASGNCGSFARSFMASWPPWSSFCCVPQSWRSAAGYSDVAARIASPVCTGKKSRYRISLLFQARIYHAHKVARRLFVQSPLASRSANGLAA